MEDKWCKKAERIFNQRLFCVFPNLNMHKTTKGELADWKAGEGGREMWENPLQVLSHEYKLDMDR